ncbi:MAG: WecB/TagA/CpsF family glycosyltransferase [Synechococcales bacterium]|nr:WecB/TagA/CpsF family glycosyltransferase [Synechococcales bacterium]
MLNASVGSPANVPSLRHSDVLGLPLHLSDDYLAWLASRLQQSQGTHVITLNAEMAMQAEQNPALAALIRRAELVVPDGAGIVLYLGLRRQRIQRCPGIELASDLLRYVGSRSPQSTIFFYGGAPNVAQEAAQRWQRQIPTLSLAGVQHGYLSADEQQQLCQQLQESQPALILVGLGVPRQEFWIAEHRHLCPQAIWIGVGGSFDIWAGVKTRAPAWLRNNHLEWTYRLYQEPWRWRRMMALPQFAWRSLIYSRR